VQQAQSPAGPVTDPTVVSGPVWHSLDLEAVGRTLQSPIESGLTPAEAADRLNRHGPNELQEAPRPGLWRKLLDQFDNFIILILIAAAVISALVGDWVEAAAIMAIVALNAALGVLQEHRAEQAMAALRRMAAPEAQVVRGGRRQVVRARELVPGDLVLLEAGNFVPADLRLLETVNLRLEEAALTGESVPVQKDAQVQLPEAAELGDRTNMAYSGTLVSYGRGRGLTVATGMRTQLGMIAGMLQAVEEEATPLQRRLDQLGKVLGWAALAVCGVVFLVGLARGFDLLEMFLVAVSLAVAAVPEGLPAVVTITLALGMREMIRRNALIRRLASVETLGSTTVICSDKTGTLTQNKMTATRLWVDGVSFEIGGEGGSLDGNFRVDSRRVDLKDYPASTTALWVGALDNDAAFEFDEDGEAQVVGDPTEVALVVAASKGGVHRRELERAYPRINEIPFDSTRKRMTTVHRILDPRPEDASPFYDDRAREWEVVATKGAPDIVLELCSQVQTMQDEVRPMDEEARRAILQANAEMARQALRVLALAFRVEPKAPAEATPEAMEHSLTFAGLIGMIDPPRPEVQPALQTARQAGVRTMMITGDYPDTARAIGEQIGLLRAGQQVLTGRDLQGMADTELVEQVMRTDVFARVSPEHKVRIVGALKENQQVVAMTGDGVNDAPALKRADIGVAMGIAGTDVAKGVADMVLTDDNYASIVAAVDQGRVIYSNIRKFVFYLLSCNLAEILAILVAILAGLPSPLQPIQLLTLNLVTDGAPALALGLEKGDPDIMRRPPRPTHEPIINREMRVGIVIQTLAIAAVTLTAYLLGRQMAPGNQPYAETMAFATLSFSELLRAFTARSERHALLRIGLFSNRAMLIAVASSTLILLAVIYLPLLEPIFDTAWLGWREWRVLLPLLVIPAIAAEITKAVLRWRAPAPEE
jgi:Ca2+-transporting ATPase